MPAFPLTATWLKIASAGQAVEIQNVSSVPIAITVSPVVPVLFDGILLGGLDTRDFVLAADLYARAAGGSQASVEVIGGFALTVAASIPFATALPAISGQPLVGQTLTASQGTWTGAPTSYAYLWRGNGAPISGATGTTYVVAIGDFGTLLSVTVTATNGAGSASVTSLVTAPVAGAVAGGGASNTADFTDPNNAYLAALAA